MKRVILLLLCIFVCSSVFAVANVGEYDIDDVSDSFAKSFISYMKEGDYLENYSMYGIYKDSWGSWILNLTDYSAYGDILVAFYDGYVDIIRYAELDFSNNDLVSVLTAVNKENFDRANWGTLIYNTEDGDLLYSLRITTKKLYNATLKDQLETFISLSRICFGSVKTALNK